MKISCNINDETVAVDTVADSTEVLEAARDKIEAAFEEINIQVTQAELEADTNDTLPDPKWYPRATSYRDILKRSKARINAALHNRYQEERAAQPATPQHPSVKKAARRTRANEVHRQFVNIARVVLTAEQFTDILTKAGELADEEVAKRQGDYHEEID